MVVLSWLRRALVVSLALVAPASAQLASTPRAEALARAFPDADTFATRVATLSEAQRSALVPLLRAKTAPRLWTYTEARAAGKVLGRAIQGDVIGKTLPITYLVTLSGELRVRSVEILDYRESHGGEVRREKWRAQFSDKAAGDALQLGADVKNIAGATLSCRALTDAVHDVLAISAVAFANADEAPVVATTPPPARCVGGGAEVRSRVQLLMGTLLELRAVCDDRTPFDAAADAAFARVRELEELWTTWRRDSEIARLGQGEPGVWRVLSPPTLALLARARELRAATGGAFAVEAGPLVELWRSAAELQREPELARIDAARAASASGAFELDIGGGRARRMLPGARLDLGAIGKGAALDEVALVFRARGISRALFDFGGQLLALDGPRDGAAWLVEVRDPRPDSNAPLWELALEHGSLSTSADDQRGFAVAGRRVSHIVDPRTGSPAADRWTACVWAPNGTDADAWSTAAFVLDAQSCASLAARAGVQWLTLARDGTLATSPAFPGHGKGP
ncbi:MAG TPA: FAD:protein FMN transferase [Planctomycetota bacterium]|nr:FAD:protein FMN transferase [Planctomycetota bacterium]